MIGSKTVGCKGGGKKLFKGRREKMWKGGRGNMWKGGKGMEEGRCVMVGKGKHI